MCLVTSNFALANIVTGTCTTFKYCKATLNCVPDRGWIRTNTMLNVLNISWKFLRLSTISTVNQFLFACGKFLQGSGGHCRYRKYFSPRTIRIVFLTRLVLRKLGCEHKVSQTSLLEVNCEIKLLQIKTGLQ